MDHHFKLNSHFNQVGGNLTLTNLIMALNNPKFNESEYLDHFYTIALRQAGLIAEEFQELLDGHKHLNITEVRDGLGDTIVTVDGLFYRLELKYPDTSKWIDRRADAAVALDFAKHSIESLLAAANDKDALSVEDTRTMFETLGMGILLSMYQLAQKYGIDLQTDQEAIYLSNMSKFDTDEEVAIAGVVKYAELGVKAELVPSTFDGVTYYVIRCTESTVGSNGKTFKIGKILKSVKFQEPQLTTLSNDSPILAIFSSEALPYRKIRSAKDRNNTIYVAGSMYDLPNHDLTVFQTAAAELRGHGLFVYNPADRAVVEGATSEDYMRHDVGGLLQCESMYLLPGWKNSSVVRTEVRLAKMLGIGIFYHPDAERE
jgi:Domain of unknown function (DUF4406)